MISIPKHSPSGLSPAARALYKRVENEYRAVLLTTQEERDTADEIVTAGLGWLSEYNDETSLHVVRISSKFVIADDEEPEKDKYPRLIAVVSDGGHVDRTVFAVLKGAEVRFTKQGDLPIAQVNVRHAAGTDVEHDSAYIARLTVLSPVMNIMTGHYTSFSGYLTESLLYPPGVDPKQAGDEVERVEPGAVCTDLDCYRGVGHPYMAYTPPVSDIKHIPVEITLYPEHLLTEGN